jgi:hypothetical protein
MGENDVLTALARGGGLPGHRSTGEVVIRRGERLIRIPRYVQKGAPLPFGPDDVILHDGDVCIIDRNPATAK